MELIKKLNKIQKELKAPKNQFNSFGKYNYRSCEDIVEAVKPLLGDDTILVISDEVINIGNYNYIMATASLQSGKDEICATGLAREAVSQKGMNDAQLTGSSSSYARKYALNGLLAIDDTKDADTQDNTKNTTKTAPAPQNKPNLAPKTKIDELKTTLHNLGAENETEALSLIKKNTGLEFKTMAEITEDKAKGILGFLK